MSQLIIDLNSYYNQIKELSLNITLESIKLLSRDDLRTKKLEINTIESLYLDKYLEINRSSLDEN